MLESINHILYKNSIDIIVNDEIYYLSKRTDNTIYKQNYTYSLKDNISKIVIFLNDTKIYESKLELKNNDTKKNIFELMLSIIKETLLLNRT